MKYVFVTAIFILFFFVCGCGDGGKGTAESVSLEGKWVVHQEATSEYARQSPRWRPEDEKYLPQMMDILSTYSLTFQDNFIIIEERRREVSIPITLAEHTGRNWVYNGTIRDVDITMTAALDERGLINFRTSMSDDMNYWLWEKAEAD